MTASPPNDKAMPDVIYAKRYGEACGGTYWNTPRQGETGTKYNRADLQAERIKRLEDALTSIAKNTCCDGCQEAAKVALAQIQRIKKGEMV